MEDAINTGDPAAVRAFLNSVEKKAATKHLMGCYGGSAKHKRKVSLLLIPEQFTPNGRGLYRQTTPLLHAACTGSIDMFSTVLTAMYESLTARQVEIAMIARDCLSRSVVAMAVASKTIAMFEVALSALDRELRSDQVNALLTAGEECQQGENLLHWTTTSGSLDLLEAAITTLRIRFSPSKIKELVMARTTPFLHVPTSGWTPLHSAAKSGSMACFEAALALAKETLSTQELKQVVIPPHDGPLYDGILNASAVGGGKKMLFDAVLAAVGQIVGSEEATALLTFTGTMSGTILQAAAESGEAEVFQDALQTLKERLPSTTGTEKIREMMMWSTTGYRTTVLHMAASSGSRTLFEAVMAALEQTLYPEQVKVMVQSTTGDRATSDVQTYSERNSWTMLHAAAAGGDEETFRAALAAIRRNLDPRQATAMISAFDERSGTVIHVAARIGSLPVFEAAVEALEEGDLPVDELNAFFSSDLKGERSTVLANAAKSGSVTVWRTAADVTEERLTPDEVQKVWAADGPSNVLSAAASSGTSEMWEVVMAQLSQKLQPKEVRDLLLAVRGAVASQDPATLRAVVISAAGMLCDPKDIVKLGALVAHGVREWGIVTAHAGGGLGWSLEVLSCLLQHPSVLAPSSFEEVSRVRSDEWMKTCILGTVESAGNPFVSGMALSVALTKATDRAPAGERRKLESTRRKVDALVLEVFERLPHTVEGFDGGMAGCAAVFEPEVSRQDSKGCSGPLWMALQDRRQINTFCTQPLLLDFLSRRFSHGLPGLMRRTPVPILQTIFMASGGTGEFAPEEQFYRASWTRSEEGHRFMDRCLLLDVRDKILGPIAHPKEDESVGVLTQDSFLDSLLSPCTMLQGADIAPHQRPCMTFLPGAQFIAAGLTGRLDQFYRVPLMRMRLDLMVYLGMLGVFSTVVLFHKDGPVAAGEIAFSFHVVAGILTELREMRRDISFYLADQWNILDLVGLGLLASGFIVRVCAVSSSWGRSLYALSSPFVFARLLFWAQTHRAQGPMIQVIFSMTAELARFGVVILVVMFGFVMAFQAIFNDLNTFGETWLVLFKALLGDVEFFDFFSGEEQDVEATILLVIYLVVISVMLLNLLIAVLSTSHARVQVAQELEYKISKVCLIEYYRLVVAEHLLPPPFNLVQLFVCLPFALRYRSWGAAACVRAREFVGLLIFWLVMGSVGLVGGTLLWVASAVYAPFAWHRGLPPRKSQHLTTKLKSYCLVTAWCLVGAPLYLLAFWLTTPLKWIGLQPWRWLWEPRERPHGLWGWDTRMSVNDMLTKPIDGLRVNRLQEYLEDPMADLTVRHDEMTKPTTVEHMKQLRNRLERRIDGMEKLAASTEIRLLSELERSQVATDRQLDDLKGMVEALSGSTL